LPELRQGLDEIERALHGPLPQLIRRADLLGDLHAHTDESDGKATLQQMVGAAKQAGLRYLTICDHSVGRAVARGLTPERLVEQGALIKQVNSEQTDGFRVLAGSEVDIRSDGRLDFPDEVLASLDFVVASIHSAMQQDRDAMTRRVLRAIENPHVAAIGHLTARIIGRRDPVALDVDAVLSAAARTGTALEINGSLERLDLSSAHVRQARDAGVTLTITTDAHDEHSFTNLDYGVSLARRAWTEAADVLNTRDVDAVLAFRQAKQRNASLP
jgi:DNA polymerase (family 10)